MELSESSLSPTRGLKRGYLGSSQKSPLYTLNSTKARAKKYNHLLQRYKSKHIERSSSANTAMSEREISRLKDSNVSLVNENDTLNREMYHLVQENHTLKQQLLSFGGEDPEEFVARFQETTENLEDMELKYSLSL